MNEKELENDEYLKRIMPPAGQSQLDGSTSECDLDDASSSTSTTGSNRIISRDLNYVDYEALPIEVNLYRLYKLHVILHGTKASEENMPAVQNKRKKKLFEEEYVAEKVKELTFDGEPKFLVKWKGYGEAGNTDEPVDNIFDCKAYKLFVSRMLNDQKNHLEALWNEIIATINAESVDTDLSDADAIKAVEKFNFYHFQSYFFMLNIMRNGKFRYPGPSHKKVYDRVLATIKMSSYYFKRLEQLDQIRQFQKNINSLDKSKNLRVENIVDFEMAPTDFTYTNDRIPRNVEIPDDPPIGCECAHAGESCSRRSNCCPKGQDADFAYTSRGLICVPQGQPVFECNKRCSCPSDCVNRVVQNGRKQSLCIFKTSNGRGWGVRTEKTIAKGQYICEYVGEVITYEETEKRGKVYDAEGRTYLFDLDFHDKDNPYTVDAAKFGNVSRFINHSCDPNLGIWAVWDNCLDVNLPKLCLFTLRRIEANEELTFDYMNNGNTSTSTSSSSGEEIQIKKTTSPVKNNSNDAAHEIGETSINSDSTNVETSNESPNVEVLVSVQTTGGEDTTPEEIVTPIVPFECKCGTAKCRKLLFF